MKNSFTNNASATSLSSVASSARCRNLYRCALSGRALSGRALSLTARSPRAISGFTLVEILVSLAILSIILGALIQTAGANASNAARLRDRAVAEWVANNRLAELQLAESFPEIGSRSGEEEMFGNLWYWKTIVQKVEDEDLRRVDIEVRRNEDAKNAIITVAGFVSHPRLTVRNAPSDQ